MTGDPNEGLDSGSISSEIDDQNDEEYFDEEDGYDSDYIINEMLAEEVSTFNPVLVWYDLGLEFSPIMESDDGVRKGFLFDSLKASIWSHDLVTEKRLRREHPARPTAFFRFNHLLESNNHYSLQKEFIKSDYSVQADKVEEVRGLDDHQKHEKWVQLISEIADEAPNQLYPGQMDVGLINWLYKCSELELPENIELLDILKSVIPNSKYFYPGLGTNGRIGGAHTGKILLNVKVADDGNLL